MNTLFIILHIVVSVLLIGIVLLQEGKDPGMRGIQGASSDMGDSFFKKNGGTTKEAMLDEMCALLGGRAAEDVFLGRISTGAMNDLERTTKAAYSMVAYAGMSDTLPNICYYNQQEYSFTKPYSDTTAQQIDQEVLKMINVQYQRAKSLLEEHREGHNALAQLLIEREVIFAEDVERIFGKRPWASRSEEILQSDESEPASSESSNSVDSSEKSNTSSVLNS